MNPDFHDFGVTCILQHYTPSGIPFYVNYPSNIIKRCLSIPDVASMIARFPVKPRGKFFFPVQSYQFSNGCKGKCSMEGGGFLMKDSVLP